jgi:hypothetical protein
MVTIYVLRKQHGNRGFYAEIELEVTILNHYDMGLEVTYLADSQWEVMCRAGLLLFYDYFVTMKRGGLKICVNHIKWLPVDTNNLIILYASVAALSEALDIPVNGLLFDLDKVAFTFPDRRNFLNRNK